MLNFTPPQQNNKICHNSQWMNISSNQRVEQFYNLESPTSIITSNRLYLIVFELSTLKSTETVLCITRPKAATCFWGHRAFRLMCGLLILISFVYKYGTLRQLQHLRSAESILLAHLIDRIILFGVAQKKVPKAERKHAVGCWMKSFLMWEYQIWSTISRLNFLQ